MVLHHSRDWSCLPRYAVAAPRGGFYAVRRRGRVFPPLFARRYLGILAPGPCHVHGEGYVCDDTLCARLGLHDDEVRCQSRRASCSAVTCPEPCGSVAYDIGRIRDDDSSILPRICRSVRASSMTHATV